MTQQAGTLPPKALLEAMQCLRTGDNEGALGLAEAGLASAQDKAPFLALAGLAALRARLPERAIPHLQALLAANPGDRATRVNLANAFLETGRKDDALALATGSADPALARVEGFLHQEAGALQEAAAAYERAIAGDPDDLSSWNNLGNVRARLGDPDGAIAALERAISIAPADLPIYLNLAEVLREADRAEARVKTLNDARRLAPHDQTVLLELGMAYARIDDTDNAIATLRDAVSLAPTFTDAHIELGVIFENLNMIEDLSALIESIDLSTAPPEAAFLQAWKARREGRFDDAAALAARVPESINPMRRFHLVGGIADRRGQYDEAFAAFTRMNREAVAAAPPAEGPTYREQVEADLARWTDQWATGWTDVIPDDGQRDPVFLVGFPRSGTTLLDTMLMGQPELSVLEERPMMARVMRLFADQDLPDLDSARIAELRSAYFGFAREFGWDDTRWLVDKHPLNMERVPTIRRLFPAAKIILAERHPCDVVLSCFMANFQLNLAMRSFTTLEEAALTYDAVFRAWERGTGLFPVDVHHLRYERLVDDARGEFAPLVRWLGLELDDRALDHTRTAKERGRVRTASYSQIGETLYTRARGRWHNYEQHLAPVLPILLPWAQRMGYEG